MTFANPLYLLLLLIVPILVYYVLYYRRDYFTSLRHPGVAHMKQRLHGTGPLGQRLALILKIAALGLFIIALARPQQGFSDEEQEFSIRDIMIAVDCSGSMEEKDFYPNRLAAAKENIKEFIQGRETDRIGLVLFGADTFLQCPLTLDHTILFENIKSINFGIVDKNGTAIGDGLAKSLNRLKHSKAKSKVIILLTDGVNNSGRVSPLIATSIAQALGVRVYTIGIGTAQQMTFFGPQQGDFDEELLRTIARRTGGKYYHAERSDRLEKIFHEIEGLEATVILEKKYVWYKEHFSSMVILALMVLGLALLCDYVIFRKIP